MYKKILVPTDGSHASGRAILAAVQLARSTGAAMVAMTVLPSFPAITANPEMLELNRQEYDTASKAHGQRLLDDVVAEARSVGVACTTVLAIADHPHAAIVSAASEHHCDLIVMASHGRAGIKGLLLGSETQKVLVHSTIPVLVYR